jgi:hypothetical protein
MDDRITEYLTLSYRHDVLGDRRATPERALHSDDEYVAALKAELKRIRDLGISNLAQRDFVSYQNARAIEAALKRLGK